MALGLAAALVVAVFLLVAGLIVFWSTRVVAKSRQTATTTSAQDARQLLLAMAAKAATDESGGALIALMDALDRAAEEGPVQVAWVHHRPAKGADGFLVRINWDGNEWRRIYDIPSFAARMDAMLPADQRSGMAGRMLAELQALRG